MVATSEGESGLAGYIALAVSMLSLGVALFALRYSRRQANAASGLLRVEQERDVTDMKNRQAHAEAILNVTSIPSPANGVGALRVENSAGGRARNITWDLVAVNDGRPSPSTLIERLGRITELEGHQSLDITFVLEPGASRAFSLSISWMDTVRRVNNQVVKI